MKRRLTDQQITSMLWEQEAGLKTSEVCRKYGMSDATFYKYKAFGGMILSDARRLRALEAKTLTSSNSWPRRVLCLIENWRRDYSTLRPHNSLGGLSSSIYVNLGPTLPSTCGSGVVSWLWRQARMATLPDAVTVKRLY